MSLDAHYLVIADSLSFVVEFWPILLLFFFLGCVSWMITKIVFRPWFRKSALPVLNSFPFNVWGTHFYHQQDLEELQAEIARLKSENEDLKRQILQTAANKPAE